MELRTVLVALSLLSSAVADEESCVGRCDLGFQLGVKCQCDALCGFYSSCCRDYHSVCIKTRGDEFAFPEDEIDEIDEIFRNGTDFYPELEPGPSLEPEPNPESEPSVEPELSPESEPSVEPELLPESEPSVEPELRPESEPSVEPELRPESEPSVEPEPSMEPGPEPEPVNVCVGNSSFDAFTDLKNGSIFAFQGKYFYELTNKGVADGYPKLIHDVWGVHGPIDAAFTRINCEGKTYLFKGEFYWRFHNGVMEAGFPRLIRDGFRQIPDNVDAALALPASGIRGKERVYFFKGRDYWKYVFRRQPSQEECARVSISVPFRRYSQFMLLDWEVDFFTELFGSPWRAGTFGPFRTARHWGGLPARIDSAMIGKLFTIRRLIERHHGRKPFWNRRKKNRRGRKRWPKASWWGQSSSDEDDSYIFMPSQSVYFFSGGDYYRVDLETKRVAFARPAYPRSTAKYWFKCKDAFD
ncbi:vitronectin-like [Hypanus sabinus]|uniref:vitronectin-like n=1 Tax=Hypanus sabinus TaxID=79690 RepID=UPI0028C3B240|nr:vitronectin-like [Hypanus sabinus]